MISKKAQFFLISSVLVVSFLSTIQTQLGGYSEANVATPARMSEIHLFNDVKIQLNRAHQTYGCPVGLTISPEVREIITTSADSFAQRGIFLNVTIADNCIVSPPPVAVVTLKSDSVEVKETFTLG